jgi:hypothetical protein
MAGAGVDEAFCSTCDYRLRGLPEPVCPECGQPFDPDDPTTYAIEPRRRRRRRWLVRGGVILALVLLAFALFPRRLLKSTMTFTCSRCGLVTTVRRWEPESPPWIPLRYPGFHRSSETAPQTIGDARDQDCLEHLHRVTVVADLAVGSRTGTATALSGDVVVINGRKASPSTAVEVLKSLMSPSNTGITIGSRPLSGAEDSL